MLARESARFLGLCFQTRAIRTDIVDAVCATAAHVHAGLMLVDELHNLNLDSHAGAEASDHLKCFAERLPATFTYAGIGIETQGPGPARRLPRCRGAGRCPYVWPAPAPAPGAWAVRTGRWGPGDGVQTGLLTWRSRSRVS
ncbi:hypothetical protein [Streptomyces sp. MST-110588]|uniref:hypothetical protein n=1 Tax=Streptomyces sp. MST-110588 TaxID=2833628 RepID=UPI001F5CAF30|nr:hypothetical protein [Streptomyces sp. MST-110588]UNO42763.1 hypothetical protein KGS77_28565 [Streptomyces sp. MST-110588]